MSLMEEKYESKENGIKKHSKKRNGD